MGIIFSALLGDTTELGNFIDVDDFGESQYDGAAGRLRPDGLGNFKSLAGGKLYSYVTRDGVF